MESNSFSLEKEVRSEFVVSEKRKKIWQKQIAMALEVKRICEKYDIKYFIIWGTLLGAVRHKGYIPWDDDFDIGFLRRDYEMFCNIARKEIKQPFFFQDAMTDPEYFIGYARIRDSRTTGWILQNPSPKYHNGIFIDLYPFDVLPENKYIWKVQSFAIRSILGRLTSKDNRVYQNYRLGYKGLVYLHKLCCIMFNMTSHPKKIGLLYSPYEVENGYWIYAKDVKRTVKLPFENEIFSAPAGYDGILQNVYKNYMKLPPRGKRGIWHERQIVFDPDMPYKEFYKSKKRRKSIYEYRCTDFIDIF
ncbi:MAG: LicD family protein [Lachnospiraceae bacterium]|nr:LicD family protein [Lachnospiraceae bacterium]